MGMGVDVRLLGKVDSNSHGARPVHLIITMIEWIRTSRLSTTKSLSGEGGPWPWRWGAQGQAPASELKLESSVLSVSGSGIGFQG